MGRTVLSTTRRATSKWSEGEGERERVIIRVHSHRTTVKSAATRDGS